MERTLQQHQQMSPMSPMSPMSQHQQLQRAGARSQKSVHININKVQAAACMATSASVSIALIAWAVQSFI